MYSHSMILTMMAGYGVNDEEEHIIFNYYALQDPELNGDTSISFTLFFQ